MSKIKVVVSKIKYKDIDQNQVFEFSQKQVKEVICKQVNISKAKIFGFKNDSFKIINKKTHYQFQQGFIPFVQFNFTQKNNSNHSIQQNLILSNFQKLLYILQSQINNPEKYFSNKTKKLSSECAPSKQSTCNLLIRFQNKQIRIPRFKQVIYIIINQQKLVLIYRTMQFFDYQYLFNSQNSSSNLSKSEIESLSFCRICQMYQRFLTNPMLSNICDCQGSISFIHYKCLTTWISTKMYVCKINQYVHEIEIKIVCCQICKKAYKTKIFNPYTKQPLELFNFNQMGFKKYIIISNKKDNKVTLIDFSNTQKVTIGRSKKNHIQLKHLTVSRSHAQIIKQNGQFYLYNCKSKYGTLLKNKSRCEIYQINKKMEFQIKDIRIQTKIEIQKQTIFSCINCT